MEPVVMTLGQRRQWVKTVPYSEELLATSSKILWRCLKCLPESHVRIFEGMVNVPYRQLCSQGGDQQRLIPKGMISERGSERVRGSNKRKRNKCQGAGLTLGHSGTGAVSGHWENSVSPGGRDPPLGSLCSESLGVFTHVVAQKVLCCGSLYRQSPS